MNKKEFNNLLKTPSAFTEKDAQGVLDLKENYPFSQMLHALSARVTKDLGFSNQQEELQLAAVYASDRAVLKSIVTGDLHPVITKNPIEKIEVTISKAENRKIIEPSNYHQSGVAEEVVSDLKRLNQSRHNFEALFPDNSTPKIKAETIKKPVEKVEKTIEEVAAKPKAKKPPIRKKATGKTKKQRIVELAKKLSAENQEEAAQPEKKAPSKKKKKKKSAEPSDALIDEIKSSKKKIRPENNRQKEQIELINQFIKAQPSITPQKGKPLPPANIDFSLPSSDFGDNIISETLVNILIGQGKKDKAIEVLRKLIWKFPQKKSYFAAQIEELTK